MDANDEVETVGRKGSQLLRDMEIRGRDVQRVLIGIKATVEVNLSFEVFFGFEEGECAVAQHGYQLLL